MLKHSINHYGSTGVPLQSPHQLTSSSHSGDTSLHQHHLLQSQINDPTRFLEGPPAHQHQHQHNRNHSHSHSYLDPNFPSIHNSRLFLDTSRISRKDDGAGNKLNGSIYFSPATIPVGVPSNLNLNTTNVSTSNPLGTTDLGNPGGNTSSNVNNSSSLTSSNLSTNAVYRHGVLRSLSLLSVLSLLLALNSLIFLLKNIWPSGESGGHLSLLYEVTLCLTAMSLSINLCVLLVCSAQYFFAATGTPGTTSFLQKVTVTRGVAIGGFFLSIPLFLCAIVLYTFTHLSLSPPALIATACVGTAIIFGGCAMVHHVFTWQKEKTKKHVLVPGVSPHPTIELSTLV